RLRRGNRENAHCDTGAEQCGISRERRRADEVRNKLWRSDAELPDIRPAGRYRPATRGDIVIAWRAAQRGFAGGDVETAGGSGEHYPDRAERHWRRVEHAEGPPVVYERGTGGCEDTL